MENAFSRVDLTEFFDRITAGITDDHDIRALCLLMLTKMITLAPGETRNRLDPIAEQFRKILSSRPKEGAVKQELERNNEAQVGVLTVSFLLNRAFESDSSDAAANQTWKSYWDWAKREFTAQLRKAEEEIKDRDR